MGSFLSPDSRFYKALSGATDLVLLNLLTLLACIPVVSAGSALSALWRVSMQMVREEESYVVRTWWKTFRENFLLSLRWWLPTALFFGMGLGEYIFIGKLAIGSQAVGLLSGVILFFLIFITALLAWFLPLFAFFDAPLRTHVANSARLALGKLGMTALCVVFLWALPLLFMYAPPARGALAWYGILLGLAFPAYMCALVQMKTINRLREAATLEE